MRIVLGTCHHDCPDSCGWQATVDDDGRAVKLRGNPDHPYSQGELCPKVNRFLDRVYAADRILTPLIRSGAKGSGEFRSASWDEALTLVGSSLRRIVADHGGEAIVPWGDAGTQGMIQMSSLDRTFFARLGASRQTGSICGNTAKAGTAITYGSGKSSDPLEIEHADLIVLWAANTRLTNRHLWPYIERARARGAQVVTIDPVRTITAESSDWFIQPRPGTDVAIMLAVINSLFENGRIDEAYVADHSVGVDALRDAAQGWTAERASVETGVATGDIERLANLIGTTAKTFIRTMIGAEHHNNGAMFFRTLSCIPVLTGAFRHLGGGYSRSVGSYNGHNIDGSVYDPADAPVTRALSMNQLGRWLNDPAANVHGLFVWNGNPVVSIPNAAATRRGLARTDLFTVVSEQFMTDTALFADVVFPATTQLEQLDVIPAWGHLYLGWNEPAIAPVGEAVPNTELWRRLAAQMDFDDPIFQLSDEELIRMALFDVDVEALRTQGWMRHSLPEPLHAFSEGAFDAPAGLADLGLSRVPTYTPPQSDPAHPLQLLSPKTHTRFLNSTYSHHHGKMEEGPYVELAAVDAAARGLADGDLATVFNARAALRLPVRLTGRVAPGIAAIPWGWWGEQVGVNALTSDVETDWGGGAAYNESFVEVCAAATQG